MPPPDPYAWPESADSGQALAERAREAQRQQPAGGPTTASPPSSASSDAPSPSASAARSSAPGEPTAPPGPHADVLVTTLDSDVRRGFPLTVQGKVTAGGAPCAHVRVDILLRGRALDDAASIGSLSTGEDGAFDGAVVVPRDLALGEYQLSVATPGDPHCGPGSSR